MKEQVEEIDDIKKERFAVLFFFLIQNHSHLENSKIVLDESFGRFTRIL